MAKTYCWLLMASALWVGLAQAGDLKLSGQKHWMLVASTKDLDTAIGIARQIATNGTQVIMSESGFYGVVLGPYEGKSVAAIKEKDASIGDVPKDSLLSDGSRYTGVVWKLPAVNVPLVYYTIDRPALLSSGDVNAEVKFDKVGEDQYSTVVSGGTKSGPSFTFTVAPNGDFTDLNSQAGLVKLEPKSPLPQVVFTRYTGGAHCCSNTWIVQKPEGAAGWSLIDAGQRDAGGYWFEDVDGDGAQELMGVDNRFLYAFDSYAGSFAPIQILKLRDGKVVDVSDEPAMKSRLKQDLAGMEFQAKLNPDLWKSNGYLAGWVASKIRLGEGDTAWPAIAKNMASGSGFGPQECTTGQKIGDCPADKLKDVPILKGLASFLKENGYRPLPADAEKLLH